MFALVGHDGLGHGSEHRPALATAPNPIAPQPNDGPLDLVKIKFIGYRPADMGDALTDYLAKAGRHGEAVDGRLASHRRK